LAVDSLKVFYKTGFSPRNTKQMFFELKIKNLS